MAYVWSLLSSVLGAVRKRFQFSFGGESSLDRRQHILSVLPEYGVIPPLALIVAEYAEVYVFSPATPDVALSNGGSTARRTVTQDFDWRVITAAQSLEPRGSHSVRFQFSESPFHVGVGLVPADVDRTRVIGASKSQGWGYFCSDGEVRASGDRRKYGVSWLDGHPFADPPVLSMTVDFDADTISFSHDGESQGVAFRGLGLRTLGPLYPAVTLFWTNSSVTIS